MIPSVMKKCLCATLIVFAAILVTSPVSSKETITWMILDWKPWMILEGEDKGRGRFNHILKMAQEHLPEYHHVMEKMNWARFWHEVENGKNLCYPFGLKSGKREKIVYYSAPHTFVLPNAVTMKKTTAKRLGDPESISIVDLLKNRDYKGYAEKNRSFTKKVDLILKKHEPGSNLRRVSESPESLVKMVLMGRVDYTIEYPIVSEYYQRKGGVSDELISIPISEMDKFSYEYMNCTRNDWGKRVIDKWNAALKRIKPTREYRRITEIGHTNENELLQVREIYKEFIGEQN